MSDFRTLALSKKLQNRISYLEELKETCEETQLESLEKELQLKKDQLSEVLEQNKEKHEKAFIETNPVYIPSHDILLKWRVEAKERFFTNGENDDSHRRLLVLIDSMEDLLIELDANSVIVPKKDKPIVNITDEY